MVTGGSDKVGLVTKKFPLYEIKKFVTKVFFVKTHLRVLGAKNDVKRIIFGNFSSFYIKNHPEEKF